MLEIGGNGGVEEQGPVNLLKASILDFSAMIQLPNPAKYVTSSE